MTDSTQHPGIFVTLEGIEGTGKTSNLRFLAEYLHQHDVPLLITREPGGTPLADDIRHFLLSEHKEQIEPEAELLLIFAARAQHISKVIRPALAAGKLVLCDRFTDTSYAYQGAGRDIPREKIATLELLVQEGLKPDLTILLDAPAEIGRERIQERKKVDRFEMESNKFFNKARRAYLKMAQEEPQRFRVIDASQSIAEVQQEMLQALQPCLAKLKHAQAIF
ncbi:MAG: dTMP kinase [Gammaproteobacteria bacterium]|nr:dTMP kinase [Gammaproteobacteria bacterium]